MGQDNNYIISAEYYFSFYFKFIFLYVSLIPLAILFNIFLLNEHIMSSYYRVTII